MELSTNVMLLICAACVVTIGGIFVMWRRGMFGPKVADTSDAGVKAAE